MTEKYLVLEVKTLITNLKKYWKPFPANPYFRL